MNKLILGVDAGNFMAKVVGPYGTDSFNTNIGNWVERNVTETFGEDDMEFEIDGFKGLAGTIARFENGLGGATSMYGDTKNHLDTKVRVLLAIHRYINKYGLDVDRVAIVTGQPIDSHNKEEREDIIHMLEGQHDFSVAMLHPKFNRGVEQRSVTLEDASVAPEASAAYWCTPQDPNSTVRILDIGSGTVNAASIVTERHVNATSKTFLYGTMTAGNSDLATIARQIIRDISQTIKWGKRDKVLVCGGCANDILPYIRQHFTNAEALIPTLQIENKTTILHPTFANAVGFYDLAKEKYS